MSNDLGIDRSGNTNHWAVNNMTYSDQMVDTPTNNFCTLNPLDKIGSPTISEGNLKADVGNDVENRSTMHMSSGKWYWENCVTGGSYGMLGMSKSNSTAINYNDSSEGGVAYYQFSGKKYIPGDGSGGLTYGASYTTGDIIGIAYNADDNEITFYKNNVSQGTITSIPDKVYTPSVNSATSYTGVINFGQDSSFASNKTAQGNQDGNGIGDFYYTPPTDFLALCTSNLPDPAVVPSEHFNTVLYTAATSNGTYQITGNGFQPDFSWVKNRDNVERHLLFDSVRGNTSMTDKFLVADQTSAEGTNGVSGTTVTVNTDGMQIVETTIGSGELYFNGRTYVMWNWNCPTTFTPTVTSGLTSASGRSNADAGFSIVKVTADSNISNSSSYTHNLGAVPEMIITKITSGTGGWNTYHKDLGGAGKYIELNTTTAVQDATNVFETTPTSTIVKPGSNIIANGQTLIFYNFASVDGYSKVGSYTGNANADGTFIYTGFRPKFVMIKGADIAQNWFIHDSERSPYNEIDGETLRPDLSNAEASNTAGNQDFLSNGFKLRMTDDNYNGSGNTYIYLAFAETPFKYSNAR